MINSFKIKRMLSLALISEEGLVSCSRWCYWEVIAVICCLHNFYSLFLKGMFARLNKISDISIVWAMKWILSADLQEWNIKY